MTANRELGALSYKYPFTFDQNLIQAAKDAVARAKPGEAATFNRPPWKVKVLSDSPLLLEIENFLKPERLNKIVASIGKGTWERSITIDEHGNEHRADPNRTSSTMLADAILTPSDLASIQQKVSRLTGFSGFDIEPDMTIVGYDPGEFYNAHHDAGIIMQSNGSPYQDSTSSTPINVADLVVADDTKSEWGAQPTRPHCVNVRVPERPRSRNRIPAATSHDRSQGWKVHPFL